MGSLNPSYTFVKSPFITLWEVMVVMVMGLVKAAVVMDVVMSLLLFIRAPWLPSGMLKMQSFLVLLSLKIKPDFPVDSYVASNSFLSPTFIRLH